MASLPFIAGLGCSLRYFYSALVLVCFLSSVLSCWWDWCVKCDFVLIDLIKESLSNGLSRNWSYYAGRANAPAPILMTTAAMVMGMIPLALGIGEVSAASTDGTRHYWRVIYFNLYWPWLWCRDLYYLDDGKQRFFRLSAKSKTTNPCNRAPRLTFLQ